MPVAVGNLEAAPFDDDGAIALALHAMIGARESEAQRVAVWARPRHLGARQEACDGGFADLGMDLAIILILHPGLRRLVENRKCEIGDILQHGDEPPLDRPPKRLLLGILIRAIWQCSLVQDTEAGETLGYLGGRHGGAIVAQSGARQAALLERLRQTMGDDL